MDSVYSLADLAAAVVCINLDTYIEAKIREMGGKYTASDTRKFSKLITLQLQDNIFLPSDVSDKLIYMLSRSPFFNNITISLFSPTNTRLRRVKLRNASALSKQGLKTLKKHNLKTLEMKKVYNFNLNTLIEYLSDWTVQNLEVLKVTDSSFWDPKCKLSKVHMNLMKLENLRELDVSYTDFNYHNLDIVCECLLKLDSLNISGTQIDSIVPLLKCKKLRRLSMADVALHPRDHEISKLYDEILLNLKELRHLDISFEGGRDGAFNRLMFLDNWTYVFKILNWPECLPHLVSLDISGQEDIDEASLIAFLENHPDLTFLGLMSSASKSSIFIDPKHPNYQPNLKVTGIGSIKQISLGMRLYEKRNTFIQNCLFTLYALSESDRFGPRPDLIQLVTKQMKIFRISCNVQVACTACLYNLTKFSPGHGNLADKIPVPVLSVAVKRTLEAMSNYPSNTQIQKNALLTLCNDRILHDSKIDRYECVEIVFNTFCYYDDPLIERLCLAVSSIVAAKISTEETNKIGSRPEYMHKLIRIIRRKVENLSLDLTLGFALSTLWNLSDESPLTCSAFLESDGLKLFTKILKKTQINESVLTKILGLFNNIAEVPNLRSSLMDNDVISAVRTLLKFESIEVSYFAAGVLAHLVSDGPENWKLSDIPRDEILIELERAILNWKQADKEMVAYSSFKPFLPLLWCFNTYQSQLWALWAVQHVLTSHAQKYYDILVAEFIFELMEELSTSERAHDFIRIRATKILNQLYLFKNKQIDEFTF